MTSLLFSKNPIFREKSCALRLIERWQTKIINQKEAYREQCIIPKSALTYYPEQRKQRLLSVGDQRVRLLRWYLDNNGLKRSDDQQAFHEHMIRGILPWLYGDEWGSCQTRVLEELGITKIVQLILIFAQRRLGYDRHRYTTYHGVGGPGLT